MDTIAPENNQMIKYKAIIAEFLSKEEIKELHKKSNIKGYFELISLWFWIIGAFALVYFYTNVFTIIIALLILGGKQLGCAIIMHDTSHYSLFKTKKENEILGNIFGAYPIFQNVKQYRPYHLQHHIATGTTDDPDINLTTGYPALRMSLFRKFLRDLVGATGVKGFFGVIMMHLGFLKYNLGNKITKLQPENSTIVIKNFFKNMTGPILFHICFFSIFMLIGKPLLYGLWWVAFFSTYNLSLRVRSIAEHSILPDNTNPYTASRTTYANFFEKLLFAPLHVNFHNEHHLLITVPCYNYPKMHKLLLERGFYKKGVLEHNYIDIIKLAILK